MVQKKSSKQHLLPSLLATKQNIQFKMIFLKRNLPLLLRGYAIIKGHRREYQSMCHILPKKRFKDILIVDVTIKIKQIPALAPLFGLPGSPGELKWHIPASDSQLHFRWHWMLVGHNTVQNSPGTEMGTGFMMKMFAGCFHTQRAQILAIL